MKQLLQKILLLSAISLYAVTTQAIDVKSFIPSDAQLVATINMKELKSKAIFDSLFNIAIVDKIEYEVLREISSELAKDSSISLHPDKLGLNTEEPLAFYLSQQPFSVTFKIIGGIANKDLFENKFINTLTKSYANNIETINGYKQIIIHNEISISWNSETFVVMFYNISGYGKSMLRDTAKSLAVQTFDYEKYASEFIAMNVDDVQLKNVEKYNYSYEDDDEPINENYWEIKDSIKDIICERSLRNSLNKPEKSISSNEQFNMFSSEMNADMFFWMDYGIY